MPKIPLTYAGLSYFDRTQPLENGRVGVEGVDLNFVQFDSPGDLFRRQSHNAEFPASEMSLSTHIAMAARGDDRFVGLPVFISRNFRHSQIYVHREGGVESPADLRGRRVGLFEYQITAALWIRGFLQHDFDVRPSEIEWLEGGLTDPNFVARPQIDLPDDIKVQRIGPGATLEAMLEDRDIDALVTVQKPQAMREPNSPIRRLFHDYRSVEQDYFGRTGLFPIMHLVVLRRDVYEAHPWIAVELLKAFTHAKIKGYERTRRLTGLAIGLPWLGSSLDEIDEMFGGDAFPYGVPANRSTVDAALQYSYEQGLTSSLLKLEQLFAPEVLDDPMSI